MNKTAWQIDKKWLITTAITIIALGYTIYHNRSSKPQESAKLDVIVNSDHEVGTLLDLYDIPTELTLPSDPVTGKRLQIKGSRHVEITFVNNGESSFAWEYPAEISVSGEGKILFVKRSRLDTKSENIGSFVELSESRKSFSVKTDFLNPGDSARFSILHSGTENSLDLNLRIKDHPPIHFINSPDLSIARAKARINQTLSSFWPIALATCIPTALVVLKSHSTMSLKRKFAFAFTSNVFAFTITALAFRVLLVFCPDGIVGYSIQLGILYGISVVIVLLLYLDIILSDFSFIDKIMTRLSKMRSAGA